ncbi:hypothetical protein FACS1894190_10860 [Spirochaetia bacterium]|nr:hypothetical protein FACS1894190_10860 [Spirochaetia bacterium]
MHAFTRVVYDHPMVGDAEKNLLIGFDRNADLLEVLYNVKGSERINVFHAMPCRKAWQHLADR